MRFTEKDLTEELVGRIIAGRGFSYHIVRCERCGDDAHVEVGERNGLCVPCATGTPRIGPPAARHRPTSVAAATAIEPAVGDLEKRVLRAIVAAGSNGMTDEELQTALKMGGNTERPRRRNLERSGLVRDSGQRRETTSGRRAVVWVCTGKESEAAA